MLRIVNIIKVRHKMLESPEVLVVSMIQPPRVQARVFGAEVRQSDKIRSHEPVVLLFGAVGAMICV
ncbi:hypothetical protein [Thiocapsa imhoffii]|nr:hypothetical protein [Thiocapsa imhoffii]